MIIATDINSTKKNLHKCTYTISIGYIYAIIEIEKLLSLRIKNYSILITSMNK